MNKIVKKSLEKDIVEKTKALVGKELTDQAYKENVKTLKQLNSLYSDVSKIEAEEERAEADKERKDKEAADRLALEAQREANEAEKLRLQEAELELKKKQDKRERFWTVFKNVATAVGTVLVPIFGIVTQRKVAMTSLQCEYVDNNIPPRRLNEAEKNINNFIKTK